MVRSRVLWILWLIATGICYVAAENAAFLLLAGVSLALPLLAAVPARQAGKKLSAELSMEAFREKGGEASGKIFIQNDGLFPADRLRYQVVRGGFTYQLPALRASAGQPSFCYSV